MGMLSGYCETKEELAAIEVRDREYVEAARDAAESIEHQKTSSKKKTHEADMDNPFDRAYMQGVIAYYTGGKMADNPYINEKDDAVVWLAWNTGYERYARDRTYLHSLVDKAKKLLGLSVDNTK